MRALIWFVGIVVALMVVLMLHTTGWMTSTVALAFFVALAIWPVDNGLRKRLPGNLRWLGHLAALVVMLLLLGVFFGGVVFAARQITVGLPAYEEPARAMLDQLGRWIDLPAVADRNGGFSERLMDPVFSFVSGAVVSTSNLIGILSLLVFLALLMLIEGPALSRKLRAVAGNHDGDAYGATVTAIAVRVRGYLAVRTLMGVVTGCLYALWSWLWNVDFALTWGLLAFLLNYIPNVGSFIGGILPAGFAFLQHDPVWALAFGGGLIVIEQVMGNYVDPRLQGSQLALSPLVVLIALLFWSWVWGLAGALIAVPMTLVIMIVCVRIGPLQPLALFLSNCRDIEELKRATSA